MIRATLLVLGALVLFDNTLASHFRGVRESTKAEDCSGYMFSQCELDLDGILTAVEIESPELCQLFCSAVYPGKCNSFYYDHVDGSCTLLKQNVEDHIKTCREIGGTREPSADFCFSQTDPCYYFHDEACTITSDVIGNFPDTDTVSLCHSGCEFLKECLYFLYDTDTKQCQLFSGAEKTCLVTVGPSSPSYEECKIPQTSVPPQTTTAPPVPTQCTTRVYQKVNSQCACGFFLQMNLTWHEARDQCAALGARLPEIYSAEENADILSFKPPDTDMWTGGNDEANEGVYVFASSGAAVTFTNWLTGEPNNFGNFEHYIQLKGGSGFWNDVYPTAISVTMCEKLVDCDQ